MKSRLSQRPPRAPTRLLGARYRPSDIATVCVVALLLMLVRAPMARTRVPGELRGRVIDTRTTVPIADVRVELDGHAEVTRTDATGEFLLRGLEPREYVVLVSALGYQKRAMTVQVSNGRAAVFEIALDPITTALGAVVLRARSAIR